MSARSDGENDGDGGMVSALGGAPPSAVLIMGASMPSQIPRSWSA